MKNDELEMWRRQWQSQPAVPLDLIRKVERQTAYMRLSWIPQIAPALIGVFAVIGAVVSRHLGWIVLAAGIWTFLAVAWLFKLRNTRGVWAPATETTAAYIELSVERCRRKLARFRFSRIMICLLTVFVLIANYGILISEGALNTRADFVTMLVAYSVSILIVLIVLIMQGRMRRKTNSELGYLMGLQRRLTGQ